MAKNAIKLSDTNGSSIKALVSGKWRTMVAEVILIGEIAAIAMVARPVMMNARLGWPTRMRYSV